MYTYRYDSLADLKMMQAEINLKVQEADARLVTAKKMDEGKCVWPKCAATELATGMPGSVPIMRGSCNVCPLSKKPSVGEDSD